MKLGCQNLMYNLLNWNVHNTYNLCSEEHGEHLEQHLFDTKFQRIKGWGGTGGGGREVGLLKGGRVVLIFAVFDNVISS